MLKPDKTKAKKTYWTKRYAAGVLDEPKSLNNRQRRGMWKPRIHGQENRRYDPHPQYNYQGVGKLSQA